MIIKGGAAGNAGWWTKHLMRDDTNARAEVKEISGLLAEDLPTALREMSAVASQSRSRGNFLYQANLNPRDGEHLTEEQWKEAVDTLEKNMGFEGHQRVVVEHEKDGRVHRHVVWNRVDVHTLRVADIGGNYYTHERTARELEHRFDLAHTESLHGEKREEGRPDRPEELWEHRAAERSGIDPKALKAEFTELWQSTDSGKAFAAALEERGYILALGDRRSFCVVDHAGDVHSLARRLDGVKAREVNARLADIDRANLPHVDDARTTQRARFTNEQGFDPEAAARAWASRIPPTPERAPEREPVPEPIPAAPEPAPAPPPPPPPPEKELSGTAAEIHQAWSLAQRGASFTEALKDRGLMIARVTRDEAQAQHRAHEFAKTLGRYAPTYRENELVVVNGYGSVYRINPRTTGDSHEAIAERLSNIDPGPLMNVTDARTVMKEVSRQQFIARQEAARADKELSGAAADIRLAWTLTQGGAAFANALEDRGLIVARVTPEEARAQELAHETAKAAGRYAPVYRDNELVVVAGNGSVYRLDARTTGESAEAIAKRLANIDQAPLMSVTDARAVMQEVSRQQFIDSQQAARPATKIEARINELQRQAMTPGAFAALLYQEGLHIARADLPGILALDRERRDALREDRQSYAPRPQVGELVVINRFGGVHRLNPHRLDVAGIEASLTTGLRTIPQLGPARKFIMEERATEVKQEEATRTQQGEEKRDKDAEKQKAWKEWRDEHVDRVTGAKPGGGKPVKQALRVVDRTTGMVSGVADFIANLLGGSSSQPEPPRKFDMKSFVSDPAARAAQRRSDAAAMRQQEAAEIALENIRRNVEAGGDLSPADLANLTREQQEQIRAKGDDGVKQIIDDARKIAERYWKGEGREREW